MSLERLALGCVFPGFPGLEPPDWVRRRLGEGLGGVVLFAWNVASPEQVAGLSAALHAERPEALVAIDEEGGDVTRLEAATGSSYPGPLALGAVDDVELTREVALAMACDLAAAGIDLDLAPVADVNMNPDNPVIGVRSFGPDAELVARHVAAFVEGLQAGGVAACAKHFPGHGDTSVDSHLALPTVPALTDEALLPFRAAVAAGVRAVMTAHIRVDAVGPEPATVSPALLGLLRSGLGFDGLVITDALEMRAISATIGVEEGAVQALAAGADALCLGHDLADDAVAAVVRALVLAVHTGRLAEERLAEAAGRVGRTTVRGPAPSADRGIGREAARRALRVEGDATLARPALVVELRPEPSIAAGDVDVGLGTFVPDAEVVRLSGAPLSAAALLDRNRQLVLVVRDAHRHAWQRDVTATLLERAPDAIVVETGLPGWRPERCAGYVQTFGASRASLEAAAELVGARPRALT
jgi:beta-N-acetylhexosaminidase